MPYRNLLYALLAGDDNRRYGTGNLWMKFKGEDELDELHRRIKAALEKWQTITPDMIQALWQSGDMTRPTSRQIGQAARMLVLSGEIEIIKVRVDGRTVTHYVRLRK